ncbi:MAG: type II toxin-antitoxin system VapC family toxin [Bifidobacteriaceae bacterium]|nr:type II toxin-antitoxin system VapC family toxin [Bifidobacteriaceae bacterium]
MSAALVLDASAALRVAQGSADGRAALDAADEVIAPSLFAAEVANALWKYVRAGQLSADEALGMLHDAVAACDRLEPIDSAAAAAALQAAGDGPHPIYDWLYLNLARDRGATLVTADTRLAALARSKAVNVAQV